MQAVRRLSVRSRSRPGSFHVSFTEEAHACSALCCCIGTNEHKRWNHEVHAHKVSHSDGNGIVTCTVIHHCVLRTGVLSALHAVNHLQVQVLGWSHFFFHKLALGVIRGKLVSWYFVTIKSCLRSCLVRRRVTVVGRMSDCGVFRGAASFTLIVHRYLSKFWFTFFICKVW